MYFNLWSVSQFNGFDDSIPCVALVVSVSIRCGLASAVLLILMKKSQPASPDSTEVVSCFGLVFIVVITETTHVVDVTIVFCCNCSLNMFTSGGSSDGSAK